MVEQSYVAIEIRTPETAKMAGVINPELLKMDFETELQFKFLVLGFPRPGESSLVQPNIFNKNFVLDVIGPTTVLKTFTKKFINTDPLRKTYVQSHE